LVYITTKTVPKTREAGLPIDCVPYAFPNVGYSHLPILPTPNCISHHSTQCCSLWSTNYM